MTLLSTRDLVCPHCGAPRGAACVDARPRRYGELQARLVPVPRPDDHLARYARLGSLIGLAFRLADPTPVPLHERTLVYQALEALYPGNPMRPSNHSTWPCRPGAWGSRSHCLTHAGSPLLHSGRCSSSPPHRTLPGDTPMDER